MSEDENKISQENDSTKFCTSCGEKLLEGQLFCSKCGKGVDEKLVKKKRSTINKKHIYIFIGVILIGIVAFFANDSIKKEKQQEAREKYLMSIMNFQEKSYVAGANLEDIADTIQTYWKENIYDKKHGDDIDAAIFSAMADKSGEIAQAKTYDDELLKIYSELKNIPVGSEDLKTMLETIDTFYNSYTNFYSFATEPSGSYVDYSDSNNTKTDEFLSNYRALENSIKSNSEFEKIKAISEKQNGKSE
ncbi:MULTISPECIES: zinc-ribbon domain-containing protein [unclassified Clostridioides]|uniref:zinc-ribbon domain-containing protein n=1 Tax=unclassified Clostridioides TaxID=2635829 RepID=UPI001D1121B3|nr:zinc-ribbon domain-containing protein [Clostridioides sp. ZZV14-6045]MCC0735319.1 zinc-ribbon domain-containing protein [Clostridioides sp. ZZV14-6009]MCC0739948.1 zinc-ribbon domain-containing protein [Clostridioides sp. ZZV14-5902]